MDLTTVVFIIAGTMFLSMTILSYLLVMPQVKARTHLKQRIAAISGQTGAVKGAQGGRGEGDGRK
nr:hypothetical protein [Alphaproteobacteria bacterium]